MADKDFLLGAGENPGKGKRKIMIGKAIGIISFTVSIASALTGVAKGANFRLGFEGFPERPIAGFPGEVKTFEIYPTLTTSENDSDRGAQGWNISMEIIGGNLRSITQKGVIVDMINEKEVCSQVFAHYDHYPMDLKKGGLTSIASLAYYKDDPTRKGAISAFVPHGLAFLQPEGTERIAKLVVEATVPDSEVEREVVLRFVDGFRTAVSQPINNWITLGGASHPPILGECRFTVRRGTGFVLGFEGCPDVHVGGMP